MNNSELQGTLVLVHPDFKDDPAKQPGQVGILTYVDSNDEIFVSFNNHTEGHYTADKLMQLKKREELFSGLADHSSLDVNAYKDLYKIGLLQDSGRSTDIWKALEIAGNNPAIHEKSLVSVESLMALQISQAYKR